jgi:signal transduction histidine kinase/CHASE3 domain sensor protein
MNNKAIFTSSFFLKRVFLGALLILIFISGVTYRHTIALSKSTNAVLHSQKVHLEFEQLLSYIKDAEIGQRGFIISHIPAFLQPYNGSREKVNESFKTLRALTADNLKQQNNLDSLHKLIDLRFYLLKISLQANIRNTDNAELLNKRLLEGKVIMDKIRLKVDEMINLEMIYLKERQSIYEDEISFTPIFTISLFLFTVLIFVISYLMINRDLKNVQKANEVLIVTTESINHAEIIGNFCTTQWNIKTRELIYSDNLYRLLGCQPHSFTPTVQNYLEFVHPEDRHIVENGSKDIFEKEKMYQRSYRIIRRDGEIRYFKSIGRMIENDTNTKTHIGVISDITEQYLNNSELEDRNLELEQSNKELASFNYVASHDLQEPLRKIQLFISRIEETEKDNLSEVGLEYFLRIHKSALRMRTLIDDLLMFSRTNKTDKAIEKTDINLIFQKAKNELAEIIEEKMAVIQTTKLPILNVIPYQIQQLFINLISNSLKYCRVNVSPVIKIECEKVRAKDYKEIFRINGEKKYYKFTFTDNGLGFEQLQSENIFILFNRLFHKTEYSGTGIGLAICKKIVENHGGFIMAQGRPNEGATFTFFLPE